MKTSSRDRETVERMCRKSMDYGMKTVLDSMFMKELLPLIGTKSMILKRV